MLIRIIVSLFVGFIVMSCSQPTVVEEEDRRPRKDIVYGRKAGMALTMDVVYPKKQSGIAVIYLLSAGFDSDSRWATSEVTNPSVISPFLAHGQTVFLVGHSATPKFVVQDILQDVHRAVRYIRYHAKDFGIDPNRIGIIGASSGGYLSLLVGTQVGENSYYPKSTSKDAGVYKDVVDSTSSNVQAIGALYPLTDLLNFGQENKSYLTKYPNFVITSWGLENMSRKQRDSTLKALSPFEHISANTPPVLLIHGDRDMYVPIQQSDRVYGKLKSLNIPTQLIVQHGANHGWSNVRPTYDSIATWFDTHLHSVDKITQ
jgi:acetyl esterase/lipase